MSRLRASVITLALLFVCAACYASTITILWDDFNGRYNSCGCGFIEETWENAPLFCTHYFTGDYVHTLPPHTGTDQSQEFLYYRSSNDNNWFSYIQTIDPNGEYGDFDLVADLAKKGQPPMDLTQPTIYRIHVYGHNDAYFPNDPERYWHQIFVVNRPSYKAAGIFWTGDNNNTWQTLQVTQTGLKDGSIQAFWLESDYPQWYGKYLPYPDGTSFMNWENLELEYTPLPAARQDVVVVADTADYGNSTAFHVERSDRQSGIRCVFDPQATIVPQRGNRVNLWGTETEVSGETVLNVTTVQRISTGNPLPPPLAMGLQSVGGKPAVPDMTGPQTVGLLARVWGEILPGIGADYFYIDDGSHIQYVPGTTGLKVYGPITGLGLQEGKFVVVTGPIGTEYAGAKKVPILRARKAVDIVKLN